MQEEKKELLEDVIEEEEIQETNLDDVPTDSDVSD
jgi:hypothetical protein